MQFSRTIQLRSEILQAIRSFFYSQGFLELDAPALASAPGQEPYLEPFRTELVDRGGHRQDRYLITSPEYACKKALSQGVEKVFCLQHVFRNGEELGGLHQPEFMMLEWYRAHASYREIMDDVEHLIEEIASSRLCRDSQWLRFDPIARTPSEARGTKQSPLFEWQRLSVKHAFARYADIDEQTLLAGSSSERYEDWFYRIFLNHIEPKLIEPTILYDYPAQLSALARLKPEDPRYAERFELYWRGVELANAFSELTDPVEQRRRFEDEQALRHALLRPVYPIDEAFLSALTSMPPAGGIALGVDRLLMLMLGCQDIEDVVLFPASKTYGQSH